jgi:hypothetical protein
MSFNGIKLISIARGQHSILGYKFGYRHRFGLITDN